MAISRARRTPRPVYLTDSTGSPASDVLDRRRDQLQFAFDAAQLGWWDWDILTDQITWSDKPQNIFDAQSRLGHTFGGFLLNVHDDDRERIERAVNRAIATGDPYEVELRIVQSDGTCRWFFAKGQVYRDDQGRPVRMAGIDMDITQRKLSDEALRRSEAEARAVAAELETVMDTVPALMFVAHGPECRVISSNGAGVDMLRVPKGSNVSRSAPDELWPSSLRIFQHGRELAAEELPIQMAAATGREVRDVELRLELEDGRVCDIFGHAAPLFDSTGNVRGAVGAFVDITERKLAERKFEELLQMAPDAIVIVDEQGRIELVNAQTEKQFGYRREEMLGRPVEMLIPKRLRARHRTHRADFIARPSAPEAGSGLELYGRRKDGSEFPVEIRLGLLKTDQRILVSSAIRDASQRKRVEWEAAHRLQQLERLTDVGATILDVFERTADDAMYSAVLAAVLDSFDSVAGCFVRFDEDGWLAGPYVSPTSKGEARWAPGGWCDLWQMAFERRQVVISTNRCSIATGLDVNRSLVAPILNQGQPLGMLHIADGERGYTDIDADLVDRVARLIGPVLGARIQRDREERERLRAEAQLENYRAELAHALRLNTMGEMAAGIAHELNQPLSAISNFARGTVRRLEGGAGKPADLIAAANAIADETARAAEIIRSLRRYVQKRALQQANLDINDIVRSAERIVAGQAHRRGVAVELRCASQLPLIEGDQIQLKQVVVNLLSNGLDALETQRGDPWLVIETRCCSTGEIEVAVADNGVGLTAENEQRIFDAFFTTKPEGLGMGLAISRSMIEAHGGRLWAEANPQGGATFRFRLPVGPRLPEKSTPASSEC